MHSLRLAFCALRNPHPPTSLTFHPCQLLAGPPKDPGSASAGQLFICKNHTSCVPPPDTRHWIELSIRPPQPPALPPSPGFPATHHGAHIWYVSKSVQGLKFLIQFLEQLHVSFPGVHDFLQWQGFSLWYRQPLMEMHLPHRPFQL